MRPLIIGICALFVCIGAQAQTTDQMKQDADRVLSIMQDMREMYFTQDCYEDVPGPAFFAERFKLAVADFDITRTASALTPYVLVVRLQYTFETNLEAKSAPIRHPKHGKPVCWPTREAAVEALRAGGPGPLGISDPTPALATFAWDNGGWRLNRADDDFAHITRRMDPSSGYAHLRDAIVTPTIRP